MVGLSDLANTNADGSKVANPVAPFALVMQANPQLKQMCKGKPFEGENFGCLSSIASGTTLYKIYAVATPVSLDQASTSNLELLGTMVSTSKFVSSQFADTKVQFQHVFWNKEVKVLKKESWNALVDAKGFAEHDGIKKWQSKFPAF